MYWGYSSRPSAKLSSRGRLLVAEDVGQQPGHRLHHHQRGQFPAGEDVVAHRELAVDQVVGDPLVHALVAPAQQGEPPAAAAVRPARRPPPGRSAGRPATAGRGAAAGRDGLDAAEERLGHEHHAGTPAEGAVVDRAVRVVGAPAEIVHADVERARALARPRIEAPQYPNDLGEDREDVDPHVCLTVQQPLGDVDVHRVRDRVVRGHEAHRDQPTGLEHHQVAGGVGLDGGHPPRRLPPASRTARPPARAPRGCPGSRATRPASSMPRNSSAAVRSSTPSNWTMKRSPPNGLGRHDGPGAPGRGSTEPGSSRCGRSVQRWTTTSPRRPCARATSDGQDLSRRRCPRWPGRRPWRRPR